MARSPNRGIHVAASPSDLRLLGLLDTARTSGSARVFARTDKQGLLRQGSPVKIPDLARPGLEVAPLLLGCLLTTPVGTVRLVEVEAYEGQSDPASHAWRGKTARNAAMFAHGGSLYVYRIHGHHCANVVCGEAGVASAVLLRAGEVLEGLDAVRERRPGVPDEKLARGPGNLCRALGISLDMNGASLRGPDIVLWADESDETPDVAIGPRVNVSRAAERPWRFWLPGSLAVSSFKAHRAVGSSRTTGQGPGLTLGRG